MGSSTLPMSGAESESVVKISCRSMVEVVPEPLCGSRGFVAVMRTQSRVLPLSRVGIGCPLQRVRLVLSSEKTDKRNRVVPRLLRPDVEVLIMLLYRAFFVLVKNES